MNKDRRHFKKVLAAICAFSGTFGGNGASAAQKNKKVTTVKTDVKSNVKSKNLSLNRQSGNKNFFRKTWNLIKANPIESSLITAGGLTVAVGTPLLIAKLIKGKKDDKDPNKKNKKEIKENQGNEEQNQGNGEQNQQEIKENQEDKKIKENKVEIKEGNQQQQQPKDNFKFHYDNLKVNGKDADNNNEGVWSVLKNAGIKTSDPVKIYDIAENMYAVCIKNGSDTENRLKNVTKTYITSSGKKISDFDILCIKNTGWFGVALNIVSPNTYFSFSNLGTDNLEIKVK